MSYSLDLSAIEFVDIQNDYVSTEMRDILRWKDVFCKYYRI